MHVAVLGIIDILVGPRHDPVDDSRLKVEQDGAGDVARVVGLVEEDIFAVAAFRRKVLEVTVLIDAVFLAELLPEL